jgi:hypothetical protein
MNRVTGHPLARHALVLGALLAIMVAMTWPLGAHLSDHVLGATYHWDAYTNTMLMGSRVRNALGIGPGGIYDNFFFAPIPDTVAFNENLFGLSLLFAPFYLLTWSPLLAYNSVLLLSLTLSAYFTFLLVRRLSGSGPAGLLAGIGFALCPYAFFELGRIQLVATQWIPLFFLFLHRAAEHKRGRDLAGLGFAYAMQVGTCLYYAMFLLPLAALAAALLARRHGPFRMRFGLQAAAVGLATATAILGMVFPYFSTRRRFGLIRSEDFAQDFDGKLAFLLHVHPTNKLLTFLHHLPATDEGAHEEIAFPGFTLALLCAAAVVAGLGDAYRRTPAAARGRLLLALPLYCGLAATAALVASALAHSFLAGGLVVLAAALSSRRVLRGTAPLAPPAAQWLWLLLLSVALFLGFEPFSYHGQVVRGLYYYLHAHVPGFDGIRKVSRQAVMVSLCFAVFSGFGTAALLGALRSAVARHSVFALLLVGLLAELRNAPVALVQTPAGETVPKAYRFIARQPGREPIAILPTSFGLSLFAGARGLAMHNYLSLFHGRRMINGKSSWIPASTHLFQRGARELPSTASLRILQILRPRFLVVHRDDMTRPFARRLVTELDRQSELFRSVYRDDTSTVYELLPNPDPTLGLLPTPVMNEGHFTRIDRKHLTLTTSEAQSQAGLALDGNLDTRWATGRAQRAGDSIELSLDQPREVAALDFTDYQLTFDNPGAFKLEASDDGEHYRTIFVRPHIRLYYAQVYRPSHFLFRVVLPAPVRLRKLRLTLLEAMPDRWWSIYEVQLWTPR